MTEKVLAGFEKTMMFQPTAIEQSRGLSDEGAWIIELEAENYTELFDELECEAPATLSSLAHRAWRGSGPRGSRLATQ
eukprot:1973956-Heterocapsa_arctica.AAC.1